MLPRSIVNDTLIRMLVLELLHSLCVSIAAAGVKLNQVFEIGVDIGAVVVRCKDLCIQDNFDYDRHQLDCNSHNDECDEDATKLLHGFRQALSKKNDRSEQKQDELYNPDDPRGSHQIIDIQVSFKLAFFECLVNLIS